MICSLTTKNHDQAYPGTLDALCETGGLTAPLETTSIRTGRPYVYIAAGEKVHARLNDRAQFVLLYDDNPVATGWLECAFASCIAGGICESDLREKLKRGGKSDLSRG